MYRRITKKWWFKWLFLGVLVRLALMPITLHPDLWGHSFASYFLAYEGKLNIYEHLLSLGQNHPLVRNFGVADIFIYPPLTYFTLGFFRIIVKPFSDPNFIPWLMENVKNANLHKGLNLHLFLYKLPYLFVDIASALFLAGLFKDEKKKRLSFALWMINPITLYATFMVGQLDILPTLFSVMALYYLTKRQYVKGFLSLGIGGSYKMYPLLLIVPVALIVANNFKDRIKYVFVGLLPFLLTIIPFLGSVAFRQMVLFSPKSQKMLFMQWPVSGAEGIFPFIIILLIIYFYSYYSKRKIRPQYYFIAILLLIYSITHYHPQWFLWVTPFLIWELVENNFKHLMIVFTLFSAWLFITLFFEPSLSFGLFNPIFPTLKSAIGLSEVVGGYTDVFRLKSIVRSVFTAASIFYILSLFKKSQMET